MTNEAIIMQAKMLHGIEEECHTFAKWKQLGYRVRKGEHAAFKTRIWKGGRQKVVDEDGEEKEAQRMFMKMAHFFTASQVDEVKGE